LPFSYFVNIFLESSVNALLITWSSSFQAYWFEKNEGSICFAVCFSFIFFTWRNCYIIEAFQYPFEYVAFFCFPIEAFLANALFSSIEGSVEGEELCFSQFSEPFSQNAGVLTQSFNRDSYLVPLSIFPRSFMGETVMLHSGSATFPYLSFEFESKKVLADPENLDV